jgi:hypothetical protein
MSIYSVKLCRAVKTAARPVAQKIEVVGVLQQFEIYEQPEVQIFDGSDEHQQNRND